MQKYLRLIGYGILTWLIPVFVSFFFYDKNGVCQINVDLFKSLMLVVGTSAGCWLLVKYFQKISGGYLRQSVIVGISWLLINWLLDALILLPLTRLSVTDYIFQIGVRYLNIPIMCLAVGAVLTREKS